MTRRFGEMSCPKQGVCEILIKQVRIKRILSPFLKMGQGFIFFLILECIQQRKYGLLDPAWRK